MFGRKPFPSHSVPHAARRSADNYSEKDFWNKAFGYARVAGRQLIHKALLLYYAAQNPRTPKWAKTAIYGALAYFVLPIDAIPDVIPGVGFTDDLGVLMAALATVSFYVNDEVRAKTAQRLHAWFGPEVIEDITPRAAQRK